MESVNNNNSNQSHIMNNSDQKNEKSEIKNSNNVVIPNDLSQIADLEIYFTEQTECIARIRCKKKRKKKRLKLSKMIKKEKENRKRRIFSERQEILNSQPTVSSMSRNSGEGTTN